MIQFTPVFCNCRERICDGKIEKIVFNREIIPRAAVFGDEFGVGVAVFHHDPHQIGAVAATVQMLGQSLRFLKRTLRHFDFILNAVHIFDISV